MTKMNRFIENVAVTTQTSSATNNDNITDDIAIVVVTNLNLDSLVLLGNNLESNSDSGNMNADKYNELDKMAINIIKEKSSELNIW